MGTPGGMRDAAESPRQAAVRELREETGVGNVDPTFAGVANFDTPLERVLSGWSAAVRYRRCAGADLLAGQLRHHDRIPRDHDSDRCAGCPGRSIAYEQACCGHGFDFLQLC